MAVLFREAYLSLAEQAGLPVELADKFSAWYELLVKWNAKINLTRVIEPQRVVAYHLADCVPLARAVAPDARLLDIGSGAGVPGLVVAALRPDVTVTCSEGSVKKVAFLVQAVAAMQLVNVKATDRRAEKLSECFDVVTARAVHDPETLARRFAHLLAPGGRLALFLSAKTAFESPAGFVVEQQLDYTLPAGEGPRRLVLLARPEVPS